MCQNSTPVGAEQGRPIGNSTEGGALPEDKARHSRRINLMSELTYVDAPNFLPLSLFLKARLIGTQLEAPANALRWVLRAPHRWQHPELWELALDESRLPLVLRRLLTPDSNVTDVGAHLGSFLALAERISPRGRHIAFEPSKSKSRWLETRFPNATIIASAAGKEEGVATFEENTVRSAFSRMASVDEKREVGCVRYKVPVCPLDGVITWPVSLIKIDVEGMEAAVLKGAANVIDRSRPVIIFESGPVHEKADAERSKQLFELVTLEMRYTVRTFSDFLFGKGPMGAEEFRRCGLYPFRAFDFLALPSERPE
jgi:FkbM family methyltransferase